MFKAFFPPLVPVVLYGMMALDPSLPSFPVGFYVFAAVMVLLLVMLGLSSRGPAIDTAREHLQEEANQRAGEEMRARLGSDVLGWPAWTLSDKYSLLSQHAQTAVKPLLNDAQLGELLARHEGGGTIGEHLALVQGLPLPRLKEVQVAVPAPVAVSGPGPVGSGAELTHLRERHHQLSVEYGEYLTDPVAVLRAPALNDVNEPLTGEFVEAYADLTALPTASDEVNVELYRSALERASKSWRAARLNADRLGLKRLDARERKRVLRAQRLLAVALDPGSTDPERRSAYDQISKLLEGLVQLPEPARLALDSRLALPASA